MSGGWQETTANRLSIGQTVRITSNPPHPAKFVGKVAAVVPDLSDGFAVDLVADDGQTATAFTSLLDRIEVSR